MDGRALAERVRAEVADEVAELGGVSLATVLVGDDPASEIYIRHKHTAATAAGIRTEDKRLPATTTEDEVLTLVADLNADDGIDGILVQTPLPAHIDESRVMRALDPVKDVDGLHPFNAGQLLLGQPTFVGATPLGVMRMLDEYGVPVAGARAVVIGRSVIVGRPLALLLLHANATVTICHTRTVDLRTHTVEADILVAAVGRPGVVTADMVKAGAAVVDVGITRTDAGFVTPVPGGVGPMTIAMLLLNTVLAARYRRGRLAFPAH